MIFTQCVPSNRRVIRPLRRFDRCRVTECRVVGRAPFHDARNASWRCQGLTLSNRSSRPEVQHAEHFSRKHELVQDRFAGDKV